jgi:hypothetical protein
MAYVLGNTEGPSQNSSRRKEPRRGSERRPQLAQLTIELQVGNGLEASRIVWVGDERERNARTTDSLLSVASDYQMYRTEVVVVGRIENRWLSVLS